MKLGASLLVPGLLLGSACTKSAPPPAPPAPVERAEAPPPAEPAPPASDLRFGVADGGLRAYDLDGNRVASLGDRGDMGRRLADGRVVVVDESALGTRLSVLDPEGTPTLELELPTAFDDASCTLTVNALEQDEDGESFRSSDGLSLQSDTDFFLNAAGTHACIALLDRNVNMAEYWVAVAVDLATGAVETSVRLVPEERCPETALPACETRGPQRPWTEGKETVTARSWAHAYDEETGVLSRAGTPVRELCVPKDARGAGWEPYFGCVAIEQVSSSGRWLLVSAMQDEGGDYIDRALYVLDLETGTLTTPVCEGEAPCTMETVAPERVHVDEPPGYTVVGESEIGAMPGDRFWIDGKLVVPGDGRVLEIGGTRVTSSD